MTDILLKPITLNVFPTSVHTPITTRDCNLRKPANRNQPNPYQTAQNNGETRQYEDLPQEKQTPQENGMTTCISFEVYLLSYVPSKLSATQQRKAVIDTDACANPSCDKEYQEVQNIWLPNPCIIALRDQLNKTSCETTYNCKRLN